MKTKDTSDVLTSLFAVIGDALAVFAGFMAATWLRFDSGLVPIFHDAKPLNLYTVYSGGAVVATMLFLFIFRSLRLYVRPQAGTFSGKIPRIVHAIGFGLVLSLALAFGIRTDPPFSRITIGLSVPCILVLVLLEKYLLFRLELHIARRKTAVNNVLILGTGFVAERLAEALRKEPRLRCRIKGFLRINSQNQNKSAIPDNLVLGDIDDLKTLVDSNEVDQVIITDTTKISHDRTVEMLMHCEKACVDFKIVPDLLYVLTGSVDMQTIDDIPLLGITRWPLDSFWNRLQKRVEDIVGALIGLIIFAPLMAIVACAIKKVSGGTVLYSQERCGERGLPFLIYKFRTMNEDAEAGTGPVWTTKDDPRRTKLGAFLRRHNIDELPQLWNVLKGDMSLVGPRPERPHFVEQFKEDISRYMWRHVSKPGMTGWAQVNGFRGNTDIRERIKYDLYYLENWSLAFDFKILAKTVFAKENAY